MTLTVQDCIGHIQHTLASDEVPAVGAYRILNDAGEYLCSCHHWRWLLGKRTTLDFEADQGHVWLPGNFRELISYDATQGLTSGLSLTTHQHLIELRTSSITTSNWRYWAAISHAPRYEFATGTVTFTDVPADASTIIIDDGVNGAVTFEFDTSGDGVSGSNTEVDTSASGETRSTAAAKFQTAIVGVKETGPLQVDASVSGAVVTITSRIPGTQGNVALASSGTPNATLSGLSGGRDGGRPEPRLDIWPDPVTDLVDALTIYYRAGWEHLDEDSHSVSVPEWLEALYIQLVRAFARGYEREDMRSMSDRLNELTTSGMYMHAISRDAEIQPDYGPMMGGASESLVGRSRFGRCSSEFW